MVFERRSKAEEGRCQQGPAEMGSGWGDVPGPTIQRGSAEASSGRTGGRLGKRFLRDSGQLGNEPAGSAQLPADLHCLTQVATCNY